MKLRTKLILSFLLMSALPLAGIVLFSYYSSLSTVRAAALDESRELTVEIGDRMEEVRESVGLGIKSLGDLPFTTLVTEAREVGDEVRIITRLEAAMGEVAPFVEALEFIPAELEGMAPMAVTVDVGEIAPDPMAGGDGQSTWTPAVIYLTDIVSRVAAYEGAEEAKKWLDGPEGEELRLQLAEQAEEWSDSWGESVAKETIAQAGSVSVVVEESQRQRNPSEQVLAARKAEALEARDLHRREIEEHRSHLEEWKRLESKDRVALAGLRSESKMILGRDFDCSVEDEGKEIGRLHARVSAKKLLEEVLAQSRRDQGEVPFAIDEEGNIYTASTGDLEKIQDLDLRGPWNPEADEEQARQGDWAIVKVKDKESGLVYGIARPLDQSLAELRATAGRNFGYGIGIVGLALVGIAPLSRRITRDLTDLTHGAELLAAGDLGARVPVRSNDEVGELAKTFNRMAGELCENQERLLQEEGLRKENEIERRLLEAENDRKGEELEEARRFQLSLLPKELPEHPAYETAVFMQTATEVGGDYYDLQVGDDGAMTVGVGDATGHGAKAGTMVTVIKSLFTAHAGDPAPARFLTEAGNAIRRMALGRMAMALTIARFEGRRMTVAAAGIPPVLVRRAVDGVVEEITMEGLPLGAMSSYEYRQRDVDLGEGDVVLMMSDGFPELSNGEGEPLGYSKVREIFSTCPADCPDEVISYLSGAVQEWTGDETLHDDVTFVVVKVTGRS